MYQQTLIWLPGKLIDSVSKLFKNEQIIGFVLDFCKVNCA